MSSNVHMCLCCGEKPITWRFAICKSCESVYGNSAANDWPDWLRELWNAEQRSRRSEKKAADNTVTFSDLTNGASAE